MVGGRFVRHLGASPADENGADPYTNRRRVPLLLPDRTIAGQLDTGSFELGNTLPSVTEETTFECVYSMYLATDRMTDCYLAIFAVHTQELTKCLLKLRLYCKRS